MTLTQTTTPCFLGTFEGFNHRDQSAIEAVLTADEVIAWNHDERGEAEFWPSGDAPAMSGIFSRHVTGPELLAVRRLVEEVGGDEETVLLRIQFACTVLGEDLRELTVDALDDQQPSIFFGRNRWDVRKEAAYELFETFWPQQYKAWEQDSLGILRFDWEDFIDSPMWVTLEVSLGEREALLVLPA